MSMRYTTSVFGAVVLALLLAGTLDAAPYQELEPREGYVPVYIREGDTPLFEINPKLAEAFNEIDTRNFLEADGEPVLEKKPDLILMTADNGDAMLIAQPADQVMSENQPAKVVAIVPAPVFESQDDIAEIPQAGPLENVESNKSNDTDNVDKPEEGEETPAKANEEQLEEAKQALKDFVNVLAEGMLEKINLPTSGQPVAEAEKTVAEVEQQQAVEPKPKIEQEKMTEQGSDDSLDDDHKIIEDVEPEEPASDVSTVDDFKTKEIDVKSIETDKIANSPDTESSDE